MTEKLEKYFVFSCFPDPVSQSTLHNLFESGEGTLWWKLENPTNLRPHGWSLETLDRARIVKGEKLVVQNGDRKTIELYEDGTLLFKATAEKDFLSWSDSHKSGGVRINALPLIEAAYNFVAFYSVILNELNPKPKRIIFRIDGKNLQSNNEKIYLVPYAYGTAGFYFESDGKDAPENEFSKQFEVDVNDSTLDVGGITFKIAEKIFGWFGFEKKTIPYSKNVDSVWRIDSEQITKKV